MKFTIEQPALAAALSKVIGAVEKRNTIPIICNFKIEATPQGVQVTATDLDLQITTTESAEVDETGAITVNAVMLQGIVSSKALEKKLLTIFTNERDDLIVKSGRSEVKLATLPPADFPLIASDEYKTEFTMQADELKHLLDVTSFAMSQEEVRYYLQGVYLHNADGIIKAVATDGHRLALASSSVSHEIPGVIIPRKTVNELKKNADGEVTVKISETKSRFEYENVTVTTKIIDGTYPQYSRVIPSGNSNKVSASANEVQQAVNLVAKVSEGKTRAVVFDIKEGSVTIEAGRGIDQAEQDIDVEHDGPDLRIGFNSKYVDELMTHVSGDRVDMYFGSDGDPMLVLDPDDDKVLFVSMPMRV